MHKRLFIALLLALTPYLLSAQYDARALQKAEATIAAFKEKNDKFDAFFEDAYGYVVFPSVGKGAFGIGGARGKGMTFEGGTPIGKARLTQLTIGFQIGGQSYSEIIFFESKEDLDRFKENNLEFAAQASAVAINEGGGANFAYSDGVAVFTLTKGGLMYEASLGGQELKFIPFK